MESRSTKVIADFFSTLLDDSGPTKQLEKKPLADLLARVSDSAPEVDICNEFIEPELRTVPSTSLVTPVEVQTDEQIDTISDAKSELIVSPLTQNTLQSEMGQEFPVLYFRVAEVTMAVPLVKLRGIYPLGDVTKLIGKPNWFHGVQVERGQNISVIDTAKYILDVKDQSELEQSLNYKYIIVLGDSNWGLLCEELIDSCALGYDDIKWRTGVKKSPWLAGTVKQRMCGLLAVDALVQLLGDNMQD